MNDLFPPNPPNPPGVLLRAAERNYAMQQGGRVEVGLTIPFCMVLIELAEDMGALLERDTNSVYQDLLTALLTPLKDWWRPVGYMSDNGVGWPTPQANRHNPDVPRDDEEVDDRG